ncbi:MAG: alternative ribosome rescue aminoacyl-tRNA hydrolase ArfB [Bowdeniella nasicola]|nr:alternative ribosome rescue aminoacyl-tRNA hydrolase ArfB [Bowdeniella nasicola]
MDDLHIAPGPGNPHGLTIAAAELTERFSRASGPGGQGVNTTDSRVQLAINLATCTAFTPTQRTRVLRNLASRVSDGAIVSVSAQNERSQYRNRVSARENLADLIRTALMPPPPGRRPTRPTRGSIRRRLAAKRRRSDIKRLRARPTSTH